jgi:hypothetical protein
LVKIVSTSGQHRTNTGHTPDQHRSRSLGGGCQGAKITVLMDIPIQIEVEGVMGRVQWLPVLPSPCSAVESGQAGGVGVQPDALPSCQGSHNAGLVSRTSGRRRTQRPCGRAERRRATCVSFPPWRWGRLRVWLCAGPIGGSRRPVRRAPSPVRLCNADFSPGHPPTHMSGAVTQAG